MEDIDMEDTDILSYPEAAVSETGNGSLIELSYLEDDPAQQTYVANQLDKNHYHCRLYSTADDITQAFLDSTPCDIALLDWDLGSGGSGLEVVQTLRDTQESTLPIVIMSARHTPRDVLSMLNAGANDFLPKPVQKSGLLRMVNAYVPNDEPSEMIRVYGCYRDDTYNKIIFLHNEELDLSPSDYAVASLLFKSINQLFLHHTVSEILTDSAADNAFRLELQMQRLKKKLRLRETGLFRLEAFYGCGYRLTEVMPVTTVRIAS